MGSVLLAEFSLDRKSVTENAIKYVDINGVVANRVVTVPSELEKYQLSLQIFHMEAEKVKLTCCYLFRAYSRLLNNWRRV